MVQDKMEQFCIFAFKYACMKKTIFLLICILICFSAYCHPWKPNNYIIIDTDGGIDDMKAITLFLASPDVRVLAITVSPGALNCDSVYIKVKSLLYSFYHEGLPVAINRLSSFKSPDFPVAIKTAWGKNIALNPVKAPSANALISEILSTEKSKITFVCLGSMSTAASALKDVAAFRTSISQILWSGDGTEKKDGFNYSADHSAADTMLKSGIPVKVVRSVNGEGFYGNDIITAISRIPGVYSGRFSEFFTSGSFTDHKFASSVNDEMVPLYLHHPALFTAETKTGYNYCSTENLAELKKSFLKILAGETVAKNQVIREMPDDPSFYFPDVEPGVSQIINKYGKDEWTSGVIANELHRHLGTYAIIGVKMGIRAREYFNTGVDEFSAVSFAGSTPPLSCMNDGIQVSTGATPGHGLLTVRNDAPKPSVEFTYMNRTIRLTLKPEIAEKINSELKEINFVYGLDSNIYWELVRKNTIKYWLNLDRHEMFEIEEILPH
jgi:pyrimidine-specific ribonucleoside hydrolase